MDAIRIILACIKKADHDYNLFNNNDRIALGVSGGKDSMALLYSLSLYKKFASINFTLIPIIIDLGFDNFNPEPIKKYCASLGFDLKVADGKSVYQILKIQKDRQHLLKLPCSICSRMKKAIINKEAHKYNCNKVSFAHHKTDAIETLFLNSIYGGRLATFSPKMFLTNEKITFIRPLIYVDENDIKRLVKEKSIPIFPSNCPNDGKTKRQDIKNILLSLNKDYPESKDNFLNILLNKEKEDLFYMHYEFKLDNDLYIKEIFDIPSFLIESKYLKVSNKVNAISHHLHIYKKNTLVGILLYHNENKNYYITHLYLKDSSYFSLLILEVYKEIYSKYNPINFYIAKKGFNKIINTLGFKNINKKYALIEENPVKLELKIKRVAK